MTVAGALALWAIVPNDNCQAKLMICYQGNRSALEEVEKIDPLLPCKGSSNNLTEGTCAQFGYDHYVSPDPVFTKTTLWTKNKTATPRDLPYAGQAGLPKASEFDSNCWTNLTLNASGKRALIVTTSYGDKLGNGMKSGLCLEEAAEPYYVYLDAGMTVDIASIKGGAVPYTETPKSSGVKRFLDDSDAMAKLSSSAIVSGVDFSKYDVVFMSGGWGAAFDLGYSVELGQKVSQALYAKTPLVASTCHGVLGFVQANMTDGTPWVKGRKVTGVTTRQIKELGITDQTPMHPEEEMRALGADFQSIYGTGLLGDVSAESTSVDLSVGMAIVTGQNQLASCVAAQRQLQFLTYKGQ